MAEVQSGNAIVDDDRVALQEENTRLLREIKELRLAQRVSDEYLSVVTHELSTPLTAIKAYVEALSMHYGEPGFTQGLEFLRVLDRETSRLIRMVDRTQQIARLTNGKYAVRTSLVSLPELVDEVTDALRPLLQERGIEFVSDLPDEMRPLNVDHDLCKQLLINLLHNAIKFSPQAGRVYLRADTCEGQGSIEVTIRDEGCGIDAEDVEHVFEPFFRSAHAPVTVERGSGLGLAIARTIVEQHGGLITVETETGKGAVFRFTLPLS